MHTEIAFIKKADNKKSAERWIDGWLLEENYSRFWDGFEVQTHKSGTLKAKRKGLVKASKRFVWSDEAAKYIEKAEKEMDAGATGWAGCYYRKGGLLYEQQLCSDAIVFNYDTGDYTIPEETEGFYVVFVDFHY